MEDCVIEEIAIVPRDLPEPETLVRFREAAGRWECRDVLKSTVEELGFDFFSLDSVTSRLSTLRSLCRAFLRGALAQGVFLQRARELFWEQPPTVARDLASLVYAFDQDERELDATEAADLASLADKYAREFLAATIDF